VKSSHNYGFLFVDSDNPYLFPGKQGKGCLSLRRAIDSIDQAFDRLGIIGASSHSWRRTALTMMHLAGIPLRVIQEISGHKDLKSLQAYLEVSEDEIKNATFILE
jgi:integrase/recombinase XerD